MLQTDQTDEASKVSQEEQAEEELSDVPHTHKVVEVPHQQSKVEQAQSEITVGQRTRRQIKPPQRYGFEDMVAYGLQVAEEVDTLEPTTYQEAITSNESA